MTKLLNQMALFLSFTFGIALALIIGLFAEVGNGYNYFGTEDLAWFTIIFGCIIGAIIKSKFLSESFITDTVFTYAERVIQMTLEKLPEGTVLQNTDNKSDMASEVKRDTMFDMVLTEIDEKPAENSHAIPSTSPLVTSLSKTPELTSSLPETPVIHEPSFLEKFFAENVLAKIGGIFLFLWVLFFLGIIVNNLGPVGRIIIGFVTGFVFFGIGVFLDQRGYTNESRTMLGVGILVNYLVILSGRYLLGEGDSHLLSEGVTFVFLILNTIFAIVTSLVYKSKTLLLFSFLFAYFNPFLIGAESDGTPYTLVGYSFIISLGALVLSQLYQQGDDHDFSRYLRFVAFFGGNILFLLAPFMSSGHWLIKVIFIGVISLATIALTYRNREHKDDIGLFFVMTYVAFGILLITGWVANILNTSLAFLGYISFLLITLASTVFVIVFGSVVSLGYLLFAPLILIFGLLVTGNLFFLIPVIMGSLFLYLIIFTLLYETLADSFKYLFFALLWVFLGLSNLYFKLDMVIAMDSTTFLSIVVSSLVFLFASYYFSRRENLEYLYSIGTIGTIFLLIPVIVTKGEFAMQSVFAIAIFALANILAPFVNRNLCRNNLKNLVISIVAGILFVAIQLYNFGEIAKLFPGIALGYAYLGLAVLYFILGYAMMNILEVDVSTSSPDVSEARRNAIFGYLGVSISLFSIAILVIFSSQPALVASIWFFEATILLFFFQKIKDMKIMIAALVLFIIGILKYGVFIDSLQSGNFIQLVPLVAIFVSFVLNLKFLEDTEASKKVPQDILHLIAMVMVGSGVMNIVPQTGRGQSIFAIAILLVIIGIVYNLYASKLLQYAFVAVLVIFYFDHVTSLDSIFARLASENQLGLKSLQYATVAIIGGWIYARSRISGKFDDLKLALLIPFSVYLFVITTQFVYDISGESIFAITIYWALWAFAFISTGISKDLSSRRTIGLYILTLVIVKILFYDIWYGIDNGMARVVALMFVGGLMIYISTLYTRKYPGNLMKEFDFGNLTDTLSTSVGGDTEKSMSSSRDDEIPVMNEKISSVDIGDIKKVIFTMNSGKSFTVKTKNCIKIAKLIEWNMGKSEFTKGELADVYEYVIKNYKSELNPADYKKIVEVMGEFVKTGGRVDFE